MDSTNIREVLAAAIEEADAGFGFSLNLVRLVDGVSTYRLTIGDQITEHDDTEEAYDVVRLAKNKVRADAILAVLQPAVTDEAVEAAARAIFALQPRATPLVREMDTARVALTAAAPFMMGDKANG